MLHTPSYDEAVLEELYEIWEKYHKNENPLCEEPKDGEGDLKADLNALSEEIKSDINKFGNGTPWESRLYFVSSRAEVYALEKKKASRQS